MLFVITSSMQSLYIMSGLPFLFTIGVTTTIIFVYYWCENRALNRATERRGTVLSDEKVLQREKVLQGDLFASLLVSSTLSLLV